uniref:ATP synthase complex subunit 8 n=1 Tax=Smyrna blomfildia TaxID=311132 RepID=A0A8F6D5U5_9NEOP|nr:ATP synthase F0 subunit 8 [Smyrna blomfildia]
MPQMMPINWIMYFFFFIYIFFIFISLNFYIFKYNKPLFYNNKSNKNFKNQIWKW